MGTGSQTLEISQNSINRGWRLNQQELKVKILNSAWTGFPWMCVCVCTHTADSKCIFFLMYFRCLFLKLSLLWVTNLYPFEVIMLGTRNLSQAAGGTDQREEKRWFSIVQGRKSKIACGPFLNHVWRWDRFQINYPTQLDRKTQLLGPWSLDSCHSGTSLNLRWLDWYRMTRTFKHPRLSLKKRH